MQDGYEKRPIPSPIPKRRKKFPIWWPISVLAVSAISVVVTWQISTSGIRAKISSLDGELDRLTLIQAQRQKSLDDLSTQVQQAQQDLANVKADLEYQQCETVLAGIQADINICQANCMRKVAEIAACEAERDAKTARHSVVGALLGIGLATVTGGTSLLVAGATGALAGGAAPNGECPTSPGCELQEDKIRAWVLYRRGLHQAPVCTKPPAPKTPVAR